MIGEFQGRQEQHKHEIFGSEFRADIPDPHAQTRGVQKVSLHHLGRRKTHFVVRTSTIFCADVSNPKGPRKLYPGKACFASLVPTIAIWVENAPETLKKSNTFLLGPPQGPTPKVRKMTETRWTRANNESKWRCLTRSWPFWAFFSLFGHPVAIRLRGALGYGDTIERWGTPVGVGTVPPPVDLGTDVYAVKISAGDKCASRKLLLRNYHSNA